MSDKTMEQLNAECQQVRNIVLRNAMFAVEMYEGEAWIVLGCCKSWDKFVKEYLYVSKSEAGRLLELGIEAKNHPGCIIAGYDRDGSTKWKPGVLPDRLQSTL
jgi:hypothetical protein